MGKMSDSEKKILQELNQLEDNMIQTIQEIVQVKSVAGEPTKDAPYGTGPKEALVKMLEISERLGFETVNMENQIGYAVYGEDTDEDYIASVGHLDVVPEGEGWKFPPYSAEIEDGFMYGRGVLDNKGPLMTTLFA